MKIQTRSRSLSEAEKRQRERLQINIKLDPENDQDIIKTLQEVDKKQTFIKDCIRYFDRVYRKIK